MACLLSTVPEIGILVQKLRPRTTVAAPDAVGADRRDRLLLLQVGRGLAAIAVAVSHARPGTSAFVEPIPGWLMTILHGSLGGAGSGCGQADSDPWGWSPDPNMINAAIVLRGLIIYRFGSICMHWQICLVNQLLMVYLE